MALSYLCKLAEGTFNVPTANLHNRFWAAGSSSCGVVYAIHLPVFFKISRASFPSFFRKKELFGASYLLIWLLLKQLFTSVSVKSFRCSPYIQYPPLVTSTSKLYLTFNFLKDVRAQNLPTFRFFPNFCCS